MINVFSLSQSPNLANSFYQRDIHCFDQAPNESRLAAQIWHSPPADLIVAQLPCQDRHEPGDCSEKEMKDKLVN